MERLFIMIPPLGRNTSVADAMPIVSGNVVILSVRRRTAQLPTIGRDRGPHQTLRMGGER